MGDSQFDNYDQFNDYIYHHIQISGIDYVADNYIDIRENYYYNRYSQPQLSTT